MYNNILKHNHDIILTINISYIVQNIIYTGNVILNFLSYTNSKCIQLFLSYYASKFQKFNMFFWNDKKSVFEFIITVYVMV